MGKALSDELSCTQTGLVEHTCNIIDNSPVSSAFHIEIMFVLKVINSQLKWSYDKENLQSWSFLKAHFINLTGRVVQSVGHLTRKSEVLGSIPGLATYFCFSFS